jgi:hypothetical protein
MVNNLFKFFSSLFLICSLFLSGAFAQTKINYVDVVVNGTGASESAAINNALVNGLSQISGQYMSASDKSELTQKLEIIEGNEKEEIKENFSEEINSFTKGVIKKFKVLKVNKENMLFKARVQMTIPTYNEGFDAKKIKIAVLPFKALNEIDTSTAEKEVGRWRRELEEGLVQTRKFQVIDKDYGDLLTKELNSYNSADYKIEELMRFGRKIGADYVLTGTLITGMKSKLNPDKQKYKVSLRIIDLATSQIKFAKKVSDVQKTIRQIIDAIYPIPVIDINGRSVTIGIGGDMLVVGDIFELVELGKVLKDPYTGEKLGYQETTVSDVEIEKIYSKTTKAQIINEKVDLDEIEFKSGKFILRSVQTKEDKKGLTEEITNSEDW